MAKADQEPRKLRERTVTKTAAPVPEGTSRAGTKREAKRGHNYPSQQLVRDCIPSREVGEELSLEDKNWLRFALEHDWPLQLQQQNPKRLHSASRNNYENYKCAKTLLEMNQLGGQWKDVLNDYMKGFIIFDTSSVKTVGEVTEETASKFAKDETADRRINLTMAYEDSIRYEFAQVGINYLESLTHNQQKMLLRALNSQTLEAFAVQCANNIMFGDPVTVEEAMRSESKQQWIEAMEEEISNLAKFDCSLKYQEPRQ